MKSIYQNIKKISHQIGILAVVLFFGGCSTIPYPELPGLRVLTGQILTKEEQAKVLTDMKKEQQEHQEVRKENVVETQETVNNAGQQNIKPAVIQ